MIKPLYRTRRSLPILLGLITLLSFPGGAQADPRADAEYIVLQTVNETIFEGAFVAMGPMISDAIQQRLRSQNVEVSDPQKFTEIVLDVFVADFTTQMQEVTIQKYIEVFSEKELAELAAFYRSDAGAAYLRHTPALMAFGAEQGEKIGQQVGTKLGPSIAQHLKEAGIDVTRRGTMDKLIEVLQ